MTYNSTILIIGIRTPIVVSYKEALEIQEAKNNEEVDNDTSLHIGNKVFTKGQVRYVEAIPDGSRGEMWGQVIQEQNQAGWKERQGFLKMSPEAKSKDLSMFELAFRLFTKSEASQDICDKVKSVQLDFFIKNPTRMLCDFLLLSPIIPKEMIKSKMNIVESRGIEFIHNCISDDMRQSKKSYDEEYGN